jgi:hypothetical protein
LAAPKRFESLARFLKNALFRYSRETGKLSTASAAVHRVRLAGGPGPKKGPFFGEMCWFGLAEETLARPHFCEQPFFR